jgi:hypothetical protein
MELPVNYNAISYQERKAVRLEYVKRQQNICAHCAGVLSEPSLDTRRVNRRLFPDGFFKWPIHLHHDHETGLTIGAVHAHCNAVLWQYHEE